MSEAEFEIKPITHPLVDAELVARADACKKHGISTIALSNRVIRLATDKLAEAKEAFKMATEQASTIRIKAIEAYDANDIDTIILCHKQLRELAGIKPRKFHLQRLNDSED